MRGDVILHAAGCHGFSCPARLEMQLFTNARQTARMRSRHINHETMDMLGTTILGAGVTMEACRTAVSPTNDPDRRATLHARPPLSCLALV